MKWLRRMAVTATVLAASGTGLAAPAFADPIEMDCAPSPNVDCGAEFDLDNPLRPNVHGEVGFERLDVNVGSAVVSDYMTLGFGADAETRVLGNQATATFNRRGDKVKVCVQQTCVRR